LFTTAQKGWSWLLTHAIVEVAKALGGSFKLVILVSAMSILKLLNLEKFLKMKEVFKTIQLVTCSLAIDVTPFCE